MQDDNKREQTKKAVIVSGLRNIWLRSKERANRLKYDSYTCQKCLRKQTKAKGQEFKVQVHHRNGIGNWDKVIEEMRKEILVDIEHLETLCKECHRETEREQ
jgi:5-methylcytosine-specific restriction endonuclease McrA